MAWPATNAQASYDRTKRTEGQSVDSVLWPMMYAKSPALSVIPQAQQIDEPRHEWISAQTNGRIVTEASSGSTTIDGSASNTTLVVTDASLLDEGAILRNATRATPIGTYKTDELLLVTGISSTTITVSRDYARANSGTGSAVHALADTFEIVATPREEGSSAGPNKYKKSAIVENYTSILDTYIEVSGTEMKRRPVIAADNAANNFANRVQELANDTCSLLWYGDVNYGGGTAGSDTAHADAAGTDSYVRTTKGFLNFLATASNLDYTTTTLTEDALNSRFEAIINDGGGITDPFVIVAHPSHCRTISAFGADKVRVEQETDKWGRVIRVFMSDLGCEARIVPDPIMCKSNLFIVNTAKFALVPYRPWEKIEWGYGTSTPDGTDSYKCRLLGEYTVKCVDATTAHAGFSYLSWPS